MIHVRMGQKHKIDRGQFFDEEAGSALSAQDDQPLGEDRVDQHLSPVHLQQEGRVADEGYAEVLRFHQFYRSGRARHGLFMALAHQAP
jgi:hypothetical protein